MPDHLFQPTIPLEIDPHLLIRDCADLFGLSVDEVRNGYRQYRKFDLRRNYAEVLGEIKTVSFEEAFVLSLCIRETRPAHVVEVGTQHGRSTRRILDLLSMMQLNARMTCFDVVDDLKYVTRDEVEMRVHDLTADFHSVVLDGIAPSFIFLDAHPYHLLERVVRDWLEWSMGRKVILAIHDCGAGLWNPNLDLPKDRPDLITSETGVWERIVLGKIFERPAYSVDEVQTLTHRMKIFKTQHGVAVLRPKWRDQ